ncbi:MAG TPA: DinB family protein [Bryobacteraceae bacterium]|nr:DinB family protein [Bryobacteraceae bacterium]
MASRFVISSTTLACIALASIPAFAQADAKAMLVKHLKTSRDFTLKVAEQMPEADYGFKLTPPQMSFAEQITHLAVEQAGILAPLSAGNSNPGKPASMKKKDVLAYVRQAFDSSIEKISKLTPAQLSKTYNTEGGSMSGLELVMYMLDHTTHHRASAEMYLRAKGITPAEYQF